MKKRTRYNRNKRNVATRQATEADYDRLAELRSTPRQLPLDLTTHHTDLKRFRTKDQPEPTDKRKRRPR